VRVVICIPSKKTYTSTLANWTSPETVPNLNNILLEELNEITITNVTFDPF